MLDTIIELLGEAGKAIAKAAGEAEALKTDLEKRPTIDTSATDATQAEYGGDAPAEDPEKVALRAENADLKARLAKLAAPPEPSDR